MGTEAKYAGREHVRVCMRAQANYQGKLGMNSEQEEVIFLKSKIWLANLTQDVSLRLVWAFQYLI